MSELKPCPFCGGPVELEKTIDGRKWWGVVCRNTLNRGGTCAIQQIPSASEEAAIERWNRRAQPEAPKPAQDLGAAILTLPEDEILQAFANAVGNERDGAKSCYVTPEEVVAFVKYHLAPLVSASPADVLVAEDRVDAERYRFLRHADLDALAKENWGAGDVYEGEELDAAIDAAIQAQKDGLS